MREDIPCHTRKGWYVLNSFKGYEMANKAIIKFGEDYSTIEEVSFNTKAELDAYLKGLSDMNGWLDFDYEITEIE